MSLLEKVNNFLSENKFLDKKILLAVSGGKDSTCLTYAFSKLNIDFSIAHCNYKLRGHESDGDEIFVEELAKKLNVPFHIKSFETEKISKEKNIGIQELARDLRYDWFTNLVKEHNFNAVATAHHSQDNIETILFNLTRGAGISGIIGIPEINGNIIRPMLSATQEEIARFINKYKISFRQDSSNESVKYARNKIRHHIIPVLKEINPSIEETFTRQSQYFKDIKGIYQTSLSILKSEITSLENNYLKIDLKKLNTLSEKKTILFEWLRDLGFNANQIDDIFSQEHQAGKQFFAGKFILTIDRDSIILSITENKNINLSITLKELPLTLDEHNLTFEKVEKKAVEFEHENIAYIDADKLNTELKLRNWRKGDKFIPLGMESFKKLSDFFIDNKIPLPEKEKTLVLTNKDDIVWVIGQRIDNRYKISSNTKNILKITYF